MNRRVFTRSVAAFALLPSMRAQQPEKTYQNDVANVYGKLLRQQCLCCNDRRELVLILRTPFIPGSLRVDTTKRTALDKAKLGASGDLILGPPADRLKNAEELILDLQGACARPLHPIETGIPLPHRHLFINQEEELQFFVLHPQGGVFDPTLARQARLVSATLQRRFRHATNVWSLSPVAFDRQRRLAMVIFRSVGAGCLNETCNVFERDDGGWKTLRWDNLATNYCT